MSSENKAIAVRLLDQIWIHRNLDVLDELFAANAAIHDPSISDLARGPEGARQYVEIFFAAFPDATATADDVIAEGDKVAVRWSMQGTHKGQLMGIPPTGKEVNITGQAIYKIVDGKIVEEWVNGDVLGVLQQIGAFPTA